MPRAKTLTMGKVSYEEAHAAAIQKTIKMFDPYRVMSGDLVGCSERFVVLYSAPRGGERQIIMKTEVRARATRLRDRLSLAWAEGFYSSGQS